MKHLRLVRCVLCVGGSVTQTYEPCIYALRSLMLHTENTELWVQQQGTEVDTEANWVQQTFSALCTNYAAGMLLI